MFDEAFFLVLRQVIEEFGYSIISRNVIVNYLSDFGAFSEHPSLRIMLQSSIADGYCSEILKAHKSGQRNVLLLDQYVLKMYKRYGYDKQQLKYLFLSIAYALHWTEEMYFPSHLLMKGGGMIDLDELTGNGFRLHRVLVSDKETVLEMSETNYRKDGSGFWAWLAIDPAAYIVANGKKYYMTETEGIEKLPFKTYYHFEYQRIYFKLHFEPIPKNTPMIDFVEKQGSSWNITSIDLGLLDNYDVYRVSLKK